MSRQRPRRSQPEEHLPLTPPVFQILLALSKGPMHGYAIMQDVAIRRDRPGLLPGTLYRALARLQESGLVEPDELVNSDPEADSRRRTYRLTEPGRRVLQCEIARLERDIRVGRARLAREST